MLDLSALFPLKKPRRVSASPASTSFTASLGAATPAPAADAGGASSEEEDGSFGSGWLLRCAASPGALHGAGVCAYEIFAPA